MINFSLLWQLLAPEPQYDSMKRACENRLIIR